MIAPANIREEIYGVNPEYDETVLCECGRTIDSHCKTLIYCGEYLCEHCIDYFDIDIVLGLTGYDSVSELLEALNVTEYLN